MLVREAQQRVRPRSRRPAGAAAQRLVFSKSVNVLQLRHFLRYRDATVAPGIRVITAPHPEATASFFDADASGKKGRRSLFVAEVVARQADHNNSSAPLLLPILPASQHNHIRSMNMNPNELKKQSDTKSEQRGKATPQHDKMQGVTTNPNEVGAGGGSVPAGQHGQDSRTWGSHDNQKNAPHGKSGDKDKDSKDAGARQSADQVGNPGNKHEAGKGSGRKH